MTRPDDPAQHDTADDEDDDEPASTPFDNPWLLPVLFAVFFLWFAYDGFLSARFKAPGKEGTLLFNQVLTPVWGVLAAWTGWRALRETRALAADDRGQPREDGGSRDGA